MLAGAAATTLYTGRPLLLVLCDTILQTHLSTSSTAADAAATAARATAPANRSTRPIQNQKEQEVLKLATVS